uniref:Acyl-[acyl-carrier-protein] hydrolase n=1 Tax=Tanacetum cinerariifolium TaxID=118510 RepID=A0A6L2LKL4_TANCI|nr:palmitoyl-acyl carrier protein thioesterase [Tanacetum cinerariifolium]
MVATTVIASLFLVSSPQPNSGGKTGGGIKGVPSSVDVHQIKTKFVNGGMQVKENAQALQRGDVVQVDTCVSSYGKHGMHRDWILRDSKAGEILTRASSNGVMMNKETKRQQSYLISKRGRSKMDVAESPQWM